MTLGELAERIGAELVGNAEVVVTGVAGIETAGPGRCDVCGEPEVCGDE